MQRRVLLSAAAAVIAIAALAGFELAGRKQADKAVEANLGRIEASLPPGYAATHGATEVNPITGTVTIKQLAISLDGRPLWSAETVTITGADQQALREVFDPAAYPNGHPAWTARRLLIEDATASGVHVPGNGQTKSDIDIGSITLHDLRGRPLMAPPTRAAMLSPALRADAALAFALQSLEMRDISTRTGLPHPAHVTVGGVILRDYDGGKLGRAEIEAVAVDAQAETPRPNHVRLTLDDVAVKDLSAAEPLKKLQLDGPPDRSLLAGMRSGGIRLKGLDMDIEPGPRISLASMDAQGSTAMGASTGEATLQGLTLALKDTPLAPVPAAMVAAFGMSALTLDIDSKSTVDQGSKLAQLTEDVVLHDLGTLHVSLTAGLRFPAAPAEDARQALMTTPIDHAVIEFHDQGLVDRALNAAAATMHTTPDVVRGQLVMPIAALGFMMPDQPDASDQVTQFLKQPGTLVVTLDPPQPVTLAQLGETPVGGRAHLLGVRVQAR